MYCRTETGLEGYVEATSENKRLNSNRNCGILMYGCNISAKFTENADPFNCSFT